MISVRLLTCDYCKRSRAVLSSDVGTLPGKHDVMRAPYSELNKSRDNTPRDPKEPLKVETDVSELSRIKCTRDITAQIRHASKSNKNQDKSFETHTSTHLSTSDFA